MIQITKQFPKIAVSPHPVCPSQSHYFSFLSFQLVTFKSNGANGTQKAYMIISLIFWKQLPNIITFTFWVLQVQIDPFSENLLCMNYPVCFAAMTHQTSLRFAERIIKASLNGSRPCLSWLSKSHKSFASQKYCLGALTFQLTMEVKHFSSCTCVKT